MDPDPSNYATAFATQPSVHVVDFPAVGTGHAAAGDGGGRAHLLRLIAVYFSTFLQAAYRLSLAGVVVPLGFCCKRQDGCDGVACRRADLVEPV